MALTIIQQPKYDILPVGQPVIYTVSDSTVVSTKFKVSYIAEVHISSTTPPNTSTTDDLVGTFKTTPNNAGVGIFDLSKVVESYVSADNNSAFSSDYKGNKLLTPEIQYRPLQTTDKLSMNNNCVRWLEIVFKIEGAADADEAPTILDTENSIVYLLFNGYLKRTDVLDKTNADFGFDTTDFVLSSSSSRFLTNAPTTQYAEVGDYGTLSFLRTDATLNNVLFTFYNSAGASLGTENYPANGTNGANLFSTEAERNLLHLGAFPANLRNWSSTFQTIITNDTLDYYTVVLRNAANAAISETITIYRQCPDLKGYEAVRLCWLNQYGVWDYYTFTKRSNRSITTQGTQYNQIEGTWNESYYQVNGYKGGKKSFRVNAMERLTINTDYVNEAEGVWFEELVNSPEVYIVNGYTSNNDINTTLSTYVEPVRLTTSSYTRKTIANDKLMQYTFELEKSKILRTQAV